MTNETKTKTYAITEKQVKLIQEAIYLFEDEDIASVNLVLDSIPLITGEQVAWQINFKDEHGSQRHVIYTHNAIGDYRQIDPNATVEPLYAQPQPLRAITAEMVTDEMVAAYLVAQRAAVEEADRSWGRQLGGGLFTSTVKEACRAGLVAAYNAVIKGQTK